MLLFSLIFFLYLIVFIVAIYFYNKNSDFALLIFAFFLIFFAGIFGPFLSRDYSTYYGYIKAIRDSNHLDFISFYEPTFVFYAEKIGNIRYMMLIFAFISVPLKIKAIRQATPFIFFSIAIWLSHYYLVNELNQVRASVAMGILLLSFKYIIKKDLLKFVLTCLIATSFHYSAILFLPMYFLNTGEINKTYFFIIPAAYILNILSIGLIEIISHSGFSVLQDKIDAYNYLASKGTFTKINVYNPVIILRILVIYILLSGRKIIAVENPYFIIMIKSYIISIVAMLLFAQLPAFGLRIADLFGIVEIILLPFVLYLYQEKYIMTLILFFFGLGLLTLDIFYNQFINNVSIDELFR